MNTPPPPPRISRDTIEAALRKDSTRRRAAAIAPLFAEGVYHPQPLIPRTRDHTP